MRIRTIAALFMLVFSMTALGQIGPSDTAPPITLEAISNAPDGVESLSWKDFGDKLVLLEFWGTWCGPCVAAIPHLNELAEQVGDRVAFLAVTFEDKAKIDAFRKKQPMRAVIGHDTDRSMPKAFGVRGWPTTFLIRGGKVLFRGSPSQVSVEMLEALSAEKLDLEAAKKKFIGLRAGQHDSYTIKSHPLWQFADNADIQIMIGTPDSRLGIDSSSFRSGEADFKLTNATMEQIIQAAWSVRSYQVSLGSGVDREKHYRVLFRAKHAQLDMARRSLAAALGVQVHRREITLNGFRIVIPPEGHHFPEPIGEGYSLQSRYKFPDLTLSGPRVSFTNFVHTIEDLFGRPIEVPKKLEGVDFKCEDISLRVDDPVSIAGAMEKAFGLRIEPKKTKVEMLFVNPIGSE